MQITKLLLWIMLLVLILTIVNTYANYTVYLKVDYLNSKFESNLENINAPTIPSENAPSKVEVIADDDPYLGAKNAKVTIIEFSDFQCPYCAKFFFETFPQIHEKYIKNGKVKFVYRDFPLSFHQNAQKASEAANCAGEQNKYWEYSEKIFINQKNLELNSLKKYAKDLGLDSNKFDSCLDSGKMAEEVKKDFEEGVSYGVEGTPAFFINGKFLSGAMPFSAFEQIIEQELNK